MCNHCPYVVHIRSGLAQFAHDYAAKSVGIVGISSNDAQKYPQDGPAKMKDEVKSAGYTFPYLYDETQAIAKAYRAACTPDIFLFDRSRRLIYRGQFDAARPGNGIPVTGKDLRGAIDAVLAGRPIRCHGRRKRGLQHQVETRQRTGLFLIYGYRFMIYGPLEPRGT